MALRLGEGQILSLCVMPAFRAVTVCSKAREGNGQAEDPGQQSPWKEGDRAPPPAARRGRRRPQLPPLARDAGLSTGYRSCCPYFWCQLLKEARALLFLGVQEQWKDFMGDLQLLAVRYAYLSSWGCTQGKDVCLYRTFFTAAAA